MVTIKIEKVDNGYILSWVKPGLSPQFGGTGGPEQVVQIQPTMKDVLAVLEKEFK